MRPSAATKISKRQLLRAKEALATHRELIVAAITAAVFRDVGVSPPSCPPAEASLKDVLTAIDLIVERDFRGPENPGSS